MVKIGINTVLVIAVSCAMMITIANVVSASSEIIIFEDDFESYSIGSYPSPYWSVLFSGNYGYVTDENAYTGSQCYKAEGLNGWSRNDITSLPTIDKIGYEIAICPQGQDTRVSFGNPTLATWGTHDAGVHFNIDGNAYAGGQIIIENYDVNQWYLIRVEADFENWLMDVYVDGELVADDVSAKGEGLPEVPIPGARYNCLNLESLWLSAPGIYYDDVKVFDLTEITIVSTVDFDPDTLNLGSGGKWVTAYIELPEGYDVAGIDASSVLLNDEVSAVSDPKYEFVTNENDNIQDFDGDLILERMLKFDREEVEAILEAGEEVTVTLTGKVEYDNGISSGMASFEGSDVITVIEKGN